jgi:U3 small nucleolar RNA-associated protein MPP10
LNGQALTNLTKIVESEDFLRGLEGLTDEEEDQESNGKEDPEMEMDEEIEEEGENEMEEGEIEMDDMEEEPEEEDDIEKYLDDQDEEEEMRDQLKIPSDLEDADEDDDYGDEDLEGKRLVDEDEEFEQFGGAGADNNEDEVFALAKEHNEMQDPLSLNGGIEKKPVDYANSEMLDRISKLESNMLGSSKWELKGEATATQRPVGSLLETVLDFNTATKLPPTIT